MRKMLLSAAAFTVTFGVAATALGQSAKPDNPSGFGNYAAGQATSLKGDVGAGKGLSGFAQGDPPPGAAAEVREGREALGSTPNPPGK
jgi:hypothetical protein